MAHLQLDISSYFKPKKLTFFVVITQISHQEKWNAIASVFDMSPHCTNFAHPINFCFCKNGTYGGSLRKGIIIIARKS